MVRSHPHCSHPQGFEFWFQGDKVCLLSARPTNSASRNMHALKLELLEESFQRVYHDCMQMQRNEVLVFEHRSGTGSNSSHISLSESAREHHRHQGLQALQ